MKKSQFSQNCKNEPIVASYERNNTIDDKILKITGQVLTYNYEKNYWINKDQTQKKLLMDWKTIQR